MTGIFSSPFFQCSEVCKSNHLSRSTLGAGLHFLLLLPSLSLHQLSNNNITKIQSDQQGRDSDHDQDDDGQWEEPGLVEKLLSSASSCHTEALIVWVQTSSRSIEPAIMAVMNRSAVSIATIVCYMTCVRERERVSRVSMNGNE